MQVRSNLMISRVCFSQRSRLSCQFSFVNTSAIPSKTSSKHICRISCSFKISGQSSSKSFTKVVFPAPGNPQSKSKICSPLLSSSKTCNFSTVWIFVASGQIFYLAFCHGNSFDKNRKKQFQNIAETKSENESMQECLETFH